jgi:ethanolamine utilization protein EutN
MQLGRVIGTVVATQRVEGLDGVKFLVVQPLTKEGRPKGEVVVAADGVAMAGEGELVYFVSSREASLALPNTFVPVDDAIVGLVDQVDLDGLDPFEGDSK